MKRLTLITVGVAVLLVLILLPGMLFVNLVSHELYHVSQHRGVADSLCFDIDNFPAVAYVSVVFDNESVMRGYMGSEEDEEECMANFVGKAASVVYVVFSLVAIFLIGWVVAEGLRFQFAKHLKYVRGRMNGLRKRLKRKRKSTTND